jgi:hypothetical protein
MFFDEVRATQFRLEAYFKGELVALRVRGSSGWKSVPLERPVSDQEMEWKQASLPLPRKATAKPRPELEYIDFKDDP